MHLKAEYYYFMKVFSPVKQSQLASSDIQGAALTSFRWLYSLNYSEAGMRTQSVLR